MSTLQDVVLVPHINAGGGVPGLPLQNSAESALRLPALDVLVLDGLVRGRNALRPDRT